MSRVLCADCGAPYDAREMRTCPHCGAYVCNACAARQGCLCAECASEDESFIPD